MRRKRFEAKMLAYEVNKMIFGDPSTSSGYDSESLGTAPNGDKIISAGSMLADMGINF